LWKLYFSEDKKNIIPKFGLNFFKTESNISKKFLLVCGFENFEKYYVRVDILERFFLKVIENTKEGMFYVNSDMINLIGSNKEDFFKLLKLMQYKRKISEKEKKEYFVYQPKYVKNKERSTKKLDKSSPFDKLSELRFR